MHHTPHIGPPRLPILLLVSLLSACASGKVTQDFSGGAKDGIRWELVTVQPDFIGKSDFLAVTKVDDQELDKPLIFGIDIVLLAPGEHRLTLMLGSVERPIELVDLDSRFDNWKAELGDIVLKPPASPLSGQSGKERDERRLSRGRNYLVASYNKIYASNSEVLRYMQHWVVNYPRSIDAGKNWSIESLDPQTSDQTGESGSETLGSPGNETVGPSP